jgi:sulfur relay (sulfurtransferase) DsrC/TusE family protein
MTKNKEIGSTREHSSVFIYFRGFYTMFSASMCNIMG